MGFSSNQIYPPLSGGLDLNSSNSGCARLGSGVAPPLGVVKEEVAVLIVLVRRHRRAVGAAVRRAVDNEHKRAKRWTALLFSSSKPKPSELQLRKGALLRRTPRTCLAQAPLPLPISLASRISATARFFKNPLAGPLV